MKQGDREFYHVLYLDEPRVDSILAQINFGLVTAATETKTTETSKQKEHDLEAGVPFFNGARKTSAGSMDMCSISETINIHHAKILQLASLLKLDLLNPTTKLQQHTHGSIYAYSGTTSILETETLSTLLGNSANMLHVAMKGNIPGFIPDDDFSIEAINDFIDIIKNTPKGIYCTTTLDKNLILGGTLDPNCFNPAQYNHSFVNGLDLPEKWITIGYCFNKTINNDTDNSFYDVMAGLSEILSSMKLLKTPDIVVVPLVIMR